MTPELPEISIPADLLPADGRFGCGPSKVRPEQVEALVKAGSDYLGTSHRQPRVRFEVGALRNGLAELFALPDGYEILLGNGGTTCFWDAASFGLVQERSQHLAFGEFSSKFAQVTKAAPHLGDPTVIASEPGTHPLAEAEAGVDAYCLTHNETSTGVAMPITRPAGTTAGSGDGESLVLVDATSAAGGLRVDLREADVYYFAPQKCLAADGGLWLAAVSPAAIERIERIAASGRWIPAFFDLATAVEQSRLDQTYNTPALATVLLASEQVNWLCQQGGLEWAASRCDRSASTIYGWADAHELASPFVADPAMRSHVVATIDFDDSVDANVIAKVLRANGIVDTESYRKLGRNQLRIALFPAIDPDDVAQLTRCIDHVIGALTA
jgi:phosphoserine aminotransferase